MESSSIRIKVGLTEVEFVGSEGFMKESLPKLIGILCDIVSVHGKEAEEISEAMPPPADPVKRKMEITTNTIAHGLEAKTGADLVMAACAQLSLVKGADTFKRADILGEMRRASNFFKQTYSNNLSGYLQGLVRAGTLLETAKDTYALDVEGYRDLYAGIVGVFRNPSAHRFVDPSPEDGGATVVFSNLLL